MLGYFFYVHGFTEVEESDSNDTLAYDDNVHNAVLCTHSLILCAWLLLDVHDFLRLKKIIAMILLHVMTILKTLFCYSLSDSMCYWL